MPVCALVLEAAAMGRAGERVTPMVVGLTGGMACGKSTVAAELAELGWGTVDSDEVVRELLREDAATIGAVRATFGDDVIGPDGGVDRRRMAGIVFSDSGKLKQLEDILHPKVRVRWKAVVAAPTPVGWVVQIPLLFEKGLEKEVDFTVCVACDATVQAQRLACRGLSPQEASQRIARQLPLSEKIERADFVITNNGTPAFLQDQVNRLASLLTRSPA